VTEASEAATTRPHKMLISYHYARGKDLGEMVGKLFRTRPQIFGDSGAFSALSLGQPISVEEYAEWLGVNRKNLSVYANLDVIKNAEATERNQRKLEALGYRPLPVFHTGSDFRHLDRLIQEYPYICLGGCVGVPIGRLMPWLVQCYKRARAAGKGTVFHGFGLTQTEAIRALPWYSVDSSSWGIGYRYGRLDLFETSTGKFRKAKMFEAKEVLPVAHLIREHGSSPDIFLSRARYHHRHAAAVSAVAWRRLEGWLRRRHGAVPFPTAERSPGRHIYLAGSGGNLDSGGGRLNAIAAALDQPGLHVYLADSNIDNHAYANKGLTP
jgi:hypothetical protein